jgi:protein SCO1/2
MSEQMSRLQTEWKGDPRLQLVTFTVDPQYDTAAVLRDYANDLQADPKQWLFLTGDKKSLLKTATEGFKLDALENPNGTPGAQFIHSTYLVLVGPNGKILDFYDGTDETEFKQLRVDLKTLLGERKTS